MDNIWMYIKRIRQEKGYTLDQISEWTYYTKQAISHWEKGNREPKLSTLAEIADILDFRVVISKGAITIEREYESGKESKTFKLGKPSLDKVEVVKNLGDYSIVRLYKVHELYPDEDKNVYYKKSEAQKAFGNKDIIEGFCLIDNKTGYCPNEAADWNDSFYDVEDEYLRFFALPLRITKDRYEVIKVIKNYQVIREYGTLITDRVEGFFTIRNITPKYDEKLFVGFGLRDENDLPIKLSESFFFSIEEVMNFLKSI